MSEQVHYVRADAQGRIIQWGTMDDVVLASVASEGFMLGEGTGDTHYVSGGQVLPKAANPAYLDGLILRDLPVPATVTIDGTVYETNTPTVELSFNLPGTYKVKVESIPYLTVTLEVTV